MAQLIDIDKENDIPLEMRDTPISHLLKYHNFDSPFDTYESAQMLIGMCIDNRKSLRIPPNFAFIIRTGGANLRFSEFKISYCIAIGRVKHIALIGHNQCGMVNLMSKKDVFVKGLAEIAGWPEEKAHNHFMHFVPMFEIDDEIDFTLHEAKRLAICYPGVKVVPMMYSVENNRLSIIME